MPSRFLPPPDVRGHLDFHVHLLGNGLGGSGCATSLPFGRRVAGAYLLRRAGFRRAMDDPDFDPAFAEYLAGLVSDSPLSHALVLAYDRARAEDGTLLGTDTFHTSNSWTLEVCRRHPELLPCVSIHPARPDARDELDRCLDEGAVALKLLPPSQNVDCSREAYRPFWEKMAAAGLPLLTHTGGEYTVPVVDRRFFCPSFLRLPLECGVKVVAAHAGTRSAPPGLETCGLPKLVAMMAEFPLLFADNSALNTPNRSHGLRLCLEPPLLGRLVHGSDFPVPVQGGWARLRRLITGAQAREASAISNPLARDHFLKVAAGFPAATFTRGWDVLRG